MSLRGLGVQLEDIELNHTDVLPALFATILPAEAAAYHHRWIQQGKGGEYGAAILDRLMPGYAIPAMDYVNAQRARAVWEEGVRRALQRYDVLIMPTVPYTAAKLGQIMVQVGDGEEEASFLRTRNLFPFNLTGMPALSVPIGFDQHRPTGGNANRRQRLERTNNLQRRPRLPTGNGVAHAGA